jgi:predicted RNA binding protein YcfA (HicA-like mRNA interferase family)
VQSIFTAYRLFRPRGRSPSTAVTIAGNADVREGGRLILEAWHRRWYHLLGGLLRGVHVSRKEKLVDRILQRPPDMQFDEVEAVLRRHGFVEGSRKGKTGSHHVFRHEDGRKITLPKKGGQRVKRAYLEMIIEVLQLEES